MNNNEELQEPEFDYEKLLRNHYGAIWGCTCGCGGDRLPSYLETQMRVRVASIEAGANNNVWESINWFNTLVTDRTRNTAETTYTGVSATPAWYNTTSYIEEVGGVEW